MLAQIAIGDQSGLNRGPVFLGVSWFLTCFSGFFLALRVYCKVSRKLSLWWDDYISIAGWIMIVVVAALTTALVEELHLGDHADVLAVDNPVRLTLTLNARASATQTAIVWTKTAFAVTLLRFTHGYVKAFVWFIIISTNVTMAFGAIAAWIQCTPLDKGWIRTKEGTCWGADTAIIIWIAFGAYSALMDFILAALPWTFLPSLHLVTKEKIGIGIAMSMGVLAGVVGIIKCIELPVLETGDGFISIGLYMWDMAESSTTVIASAIPALRVLLGSKSRRLYLTPRLPYINQTDKTSQTPVEKNAGPESPHTLVNSKKPSWVSSHGEVFELSQPSSAHVV